MNFLWHPGPLGHLLIASAAATWLLDGLRTAASGARVARPRYGRRPVTRLRATIDDTDIEVDARILQAKQDLLERVYAGEAGVPVGEIPVINSGDPCDEEAIICEVDEDVSDPGYTTTAAAAMTAAAALPRSQAV